MKMHDSTARLTISSGVLAAKKLLFNLRVTVHLIAELFHSTQKGLEVFEHAAVAGRIQRYSGNGLGNAELDE